MLTVHSVLLMHIIDILDGYVCNLFIDWILMKDDLSVKCWLVMSCSAFWMDKFFVFFFSSYVQSSDPADKDAWKDRGTGQLSIKCKEGVSKGTKESKPTIVIRNDVCSVMVFFWIVKHFLIPLLWFSHWLYFFFFFPLLPTPL